MGLHYSPRIVTDRLELILDGGGVTITSKGWWGYNGSTWVKLN